MHEPTCITRTGRVGRRLCFVGHFAVTLSLLTVTSAGAQSTPPDSAEIYERLANAKPDGRTYAEFNRNKLRDARRALAMYEQRGDTAGQARVLVLIAESYDPTIIDSVVVISRRAVSLLRQSNADSSMLAEAVGLLAYAMIYSRAPLDSSAPLRAENIRLRHQYPAPRKMGRELYAFGQAFSIRSGNDSAVFGKKFMDDSALFYLHAAVNAARIAADSDAVAGIYGDIANHWTRNSRLDSALLYRQRGYAMSRFFKDPRQGIYDMRSIIEYFRIAPTVDRSKGLMRNLDSALTWAHDYAKATETLESREQLVAVYLLSDLFFQIGKPDSARFYIELARDMATKSANPNPNQYFVSLARFYDVVGFTDSSLVIRRALVRQFDSVAGPASRGARIATSRGLASAHFTRGDLDSALFWTDAVLSAIGSDTLVYGFPFVDLQRRAEVHRWRGDADSALAAYSRIQLKANLTDPRSALLPTLQLRRRVAWLGQAAVLSGIGAVDSAQAFIEKDFTAMKGYPMYRNSSDSVGALAAMARIHRYRGKPDSALILDVKVLRLAREDGMMATEIDALVALGEDFEAVGTLDSALTQYRAAVSTTERRLMRPQAVLSLGSLASWYLAVDVPDSALSIARRAVAIAGQTASPWLIADARYRLGIVFGALGQSDSAATNLESTLNQRGRPIGPSLVALGNLRLRMGQPDSARALLYAALRSYRASGARPAIAQTLTSLSRVERRLGHADSALAIAGEALVLARATQDRLTEGRALAALGSARFLLG